MAEQAPKAEKEKDRNLLWWSLGIVTALIVGVELISD